MMFNDVETMKIKWLGSGEKAYRVRVRFGPHGQVRMLKKIFKRARDARAYGDRALRMLRALDGMKMDVQDVGI